MSLNKFQSVAGKLQHASFGTPGGASLFTPVQREMLNDPEYIPMSKELKQILRDWSYMIKCLRKKPTHVAQLLPDYPFYAGHTDACGLGCGGTWSSAMKSLNPIVWQLEWPPAVREAFRKGYININELELAALVLGWLVLELQGVDLKLAHIGSYCDNTTAVAWAYKLRTSTSPVAGRLLRMLGMRIHTREASGLTPIYIKGEENAMADVASRAFKNGKFFLQTLTLTDYFDAHFPLPQLMSWQEFRVPTALQSRVISCLLGKPLPLASLIRLPGLGKNTGTTGKNMQPCATSTHSSATKPSLNSKKKLSSAPMVQGSGRVITEEDARSAFKELTMRSRPSPRPSNWLENKVASTKRHPPPTPPT